MRVLAQVPVVQPDVAGMPGSSTIMEAVAWGLAGALIACAVAAFVSAGRMAWSRASGYVEGGRSGRSGFVMALIGAALAMAAIPLVNWAAGLGQQAI